MSHHNNSFPEQFQSHLTAAGKSSHTVKAYGRDLAAFVQWWTGTYGRDFTPAAIDPNDIVEYRSYLQRQGRKPATINRRLNALNKFFRWARRSQPSLDNPFDLLEGVFLRQQQAALAPAWLPRRQQLALLRAARENGSKRDLVIL